MKAVLFDKPGGADQLYLGEVPTPIPGPSDLLVKIAYTALNRADILQREGQYPVPPDDSPIMGLEMSGEVVDIGEQVTKHHPGDLVYGLLNGGGYAEYAIIHEDMALALPAGLGLQEAAGIPEVFLTAFQALHWIGRMKSDDTVLIHAGASGVGTAALQLVALAGAKSMVTASAAKHDLCRRLGAALTIDYQRQDFAAETLAFTQNQGADIIIDFIAADYFQQNLRALATDGRLIMLALMGGIKVPEVNLATILRKRLQITGSTLRSRSLAYKIQLTREFDQYTRPHFFSGRLHPVIDQVYPLEAVADAQRYMESNQSQGKILLAIDPS